MKKIFTTLLFLLTIIASQAQTDPQELNGAGVYNFNEEELALFQDVLDLKFTKVHLEIGKLKQKNPFNLVPYYIEDYLDFLQAFIDGKPKVIYGKYAEHIEERAKWLDQGNPASPYHLMMQGDILLRWGLIYAMIGDDKMAVKNIKKAVSLLDKNAEAHPKFMANKRTLGLLHVLTGGYPTEQKWGGSAATLKNDVNLGIAEVEDVIDYGKKIKGFEFNTEIQLLYGIILAFIGSKEDKAWGIMNTEKMDYTQSPLVAYVLAKRFIRTGKSQKAILVLEKCASGDDYYYFPYLDVLRGMTKLYRLDKDAEDDFKRYVERYRGVNYVKEAYQHLGWVSILRKKEHEYKYYMGLAEKKGEYNTFRDRDAMNEAQDAKEGVTPELYLMEARLLFEGGYYDRAYAAINKSSIKSIKTEEHKVEYYYLKGRILRLMKRNDDAMKALEQAIKLGFKKPYFYACNSHLIIGEIWEERREPAKAIEAYKKCFKEKPDQYKAVLFSKAKARIAYLEEKSGKGKKK